MWEVIVLAVFNSTKYMHFRTRNIIALTNGTVVDDIYEDPIITIHYFSCLCLCDHIFSPFLMDLHPYKPLSGFGYFYSSLFRIKIQR